MGKSHSPPYKIKWQGTADFYSEFSQIPIFLKETQRKTSYLCKQSLELFHES